MICPACAAPLSAARTARTMLWHCTACGGLAATLAAVRTVAAPELIAAAWSAAQAMADDGRQCPSCRLLMRVVDAPPSGPCIDLCMPCQLSWFDAGELEAMAGGSRSAAPAELSPAAREAAARLEAHSLAEQAAPGATVRTWQEVLEALWLVVRLP